MAQALLEGITDNAGVVERLRDELQDSRMEVARLLQVNRQLDEALRLERIRTQTVDGAARELKVILLPLYHALQKIFGEFHDMGFAEVGEPAAPQFDKKWEAWKSKLGPTTAAARIIQAILDHGPLNRSQLRQATKSGWSTLDEATARLKNLQLIEKANDRWNLKA